MSHRRLDGFLVRLYPVQWRSRYGEELEALMLDSSEGGGSTLRARANVAFAGVRERLRTAGLIGDGLPPSDRARAGALLVLCAWVGFVVAGAGVAKFSEHWQDATPAGSRGVPAAAFDALMIAAAAGTFLVLAGIAVVLPSLVRFLSRGGWPQIRARVLTAATLSGLTVVATVALAAWAHRLNVHQRNGGDLLYSGAFVAWALAAAACLGSWTAAAIATARRLTLPASVLRLDTLIASAVCVAMAVMTVATVTWWAALAHSAPWALTGQRPGQAAASLPPQLLAFTVVMVIASVLGTVGATKAIRTLPDLRRPASAR
jgi:hypothetical protein